MIAGSELHVVFDQVGVLRWIERLVVASERAVPWTGRCRSTMSHYRGTPVTNTGGTVIMLARSWASLPMSTLTRSHRIE